MNLVVVHLVFVYLLVVRSKRGGGDEVNTCRHVDQLFITKRVPRASSFYTPINVKLELPGLSCGCCRSELSQ